MKEYKSGKEKNSSVLRVLFLSFCFFLVGTMAFAQSGIVITGTVQDDMGPLPGVSVAIKGTTTGTLSDLDGKFSLSVPNDKVTLTFSFVGYISQNIAIGANRNLNVVMATEDNSLDEIVVIGYGAVRKKDLTGAISSVSSKDLVSVPATTAAQALQGKAAGVNIVTASGAPGAGVEVTIRGGTSITQSTKPLYIVDGFEMTDALTNIAVHDIESIEVLKDASSTAIYGARGSNGIILITTKSGKKGKTTVSYNTYFSFDKISKKLDMMSNSEDFVKYQYEMAELQGKTTQWSNVFDNSMGVDNPEFYTGVYGRINNRYSGVGGINWQDEVFGGSALTQSHNVSISTGSEHTQVLLTYNYNGQDGLLANHSYDKNTVRAKVKSELYKGIRLDFNSMFSNASTDGGGKYDGMKSVLLQPINGGTMFTRDQLLNTQTYPDFSSLDSSYDTANPIVQNNASTSNKRARLFNVNAGLEIDFLKHFTWRTSGNYEWTNSKSTSFADENSTSYLMDPVNTGINGSIGNSEEYRYQITNTVNYSQTFAEKHKVGAMLGHEVTYNESEENSMKLKQFPYPNYGLDDISNATVYEKEAKHSRNGLVSLFARVNYTYDERYLLTATIRKDGSSKFSKDNKWGTFPSVAGAWRVSEEKFWKGSKIENTISSLKLRVGYGITGNNGIGNNLYSTTMTQTDYPINNTTGNPAYVPSTTLGNKDLKWETLRATNIGLDLGLFNSRVNFTAEWYNNEISDMLMASVIPASTGYTKQYQNVGEMRNRGWEFTLNTVNVRTKDFQWTTDLNLSFNKSKVTSLEKGLTDKTFTVGGNRSGTLTYYAVVGQKLGDMYGYVYEGVYTTDDFIQNGDGSLTLKDGVVKPYGDTTPSPGDMKFAADNEEGDQFTRQLVKIGNGTPDMIGGFTNTFVYKGFDLNVFMKFSIGNDIYNASKHSMSPYALFQNVPSKFGDNYYRLIDPATGKKATTLARMKELNPNESSRTWSLNNTNSSYITYPSSYYVEDGSYLRLAQVTIGYTLPKTWLQKAMISSARIYFTANNLATITGYSGYDPEVSAGDSDYVICTPGYDSSTYPRSRSYVVGLNLTF
ncbi:SusC/RagA family TonB-linked outer membrane protein [Dysgonomonas macrotermitis]|uniref:TonB-linked outer membrane protein, SusC/RagA family n=1 Tax=Dysgonomonas macrotermitis TaxID=1346286 RepID=A0A1M4TID8_9BACT|nr:TonB-dependent receptor [Dysgonomonas macrotermitis]SHE44206.1 TonB-linked outer membrane protein, SusC/RagA family [Dysgonomonas macrotermitis]